MKSFLTVISLAFALVTPAFADIEWDFNSPGNPLVLGTGDTATITKGAMGKGHQDLTVAPWSTFSASGVSGAWDMGAVGTILLSSLSVSGPQTLDAYQWVDPASGACKDLQPYNGLLAFAVAGPGGASGFLTPVVTVTGAGWYDYSVNLASLGTGQVTITTSGGGAMINRVSLAAVPEISTWVAGAVLLIPFLLSTRPILRRRHQS
jgi:hypothetical protein